MYLEFRSQAGHDLLTKSLENLTQKIRLLNIRTEGEEEEETTIATVYIPAGKEEYFLKIIRQYQDTDKHSKLARSIEDVRMAVLESFWQDRPTLIPRQSRQWCEVWLRVVPGQEATIEAQFRTLCASAGIPCKAGQVRFPERTVLLVEAQDRDLAELIEGNAFIAEFRLAKETAEFWVELPNVEQAQWVQDLLGRIEVNDRGVSVCVLDTGANNGHPLLAPFLTDANCQSVDPNWGTHDHDPKGHGTTMCGVVIYGDLQHLLLSRGPVEINHLLESVKIYRPSPQENPKELWGYITSQAVSRAEIQNPDRRRITCMAVTSEDDRDGGRPSSWSAAVDAISAGYNEEDEAKRLLVVSAGNVNDPDEWLRYPQSNQTLTVHDPGQAWNALTVGAMTKKTDIRHPDFQGYAPIAPYGGLSPFSTTSLIWDRKWPIKPEIVLEGGNAAKNAHGADTPDDLAILTTHHDYSNRHFSVMNATSAATAEASRMAAIIQGAYPQAWPETVRGLMVHSANWTPELLQQFGITSTSNKRDYANLLRTCGYGVPDLEKALYCAGNSLTLIAQRTIQPYARKETGTGFRTKDMHLYELPWPKDVLLSLGNLEVTLRATLSYFIEPGPGEIGWKDRYRYPSFGLRFDLNSPHETKKQFVKRLNAAARDEEEGVTSESASDRWTIGSKTRHLGSIHSDMWKGYAAEIASCHMVGIYPIIGWWRERSYLNQGERTARYSFILSLHTEAQEVDIYTPVAIALKTSIPLAKQ